MHFFAFYLTIPSSKRKKNKRLVREQLFTAAVTYSELVARRLQLRLFPPIVFISVILICKLHLWRNATLHVVSFKAPSSLPFWRIPTSGTVRITSMKHPANI